MNRWQCKKCINKNVLLDETTNTFECEECGTQYIIRENILEET